MGRRFSAPVVRRSRKTKIIAGVVAVVAAATAAAFVIPGAPGRTLVRLATNMECYRAGEPGGVAAIGDSITAGNGLPGWGFLPEESWLSQSVCASDLPFTHNAGVATQTTPQIAARLDGVLSHDPSVVVVLAGTNDVYEGDFSGEAVDRIRAMLDKIEESGAVPVLGTLPPMDGKTSEVVRFNALLRDLSRTEDVRLIDFYSVLAQGENYRPGMTRDGIHPSVAGAEAMGKAALPVLEDAHQHRTG